MVNFRHYGDVANLTELLIILKESHFENFLDIFAGIPQCCAALFIIKSQTAYVTAMAFEPTAS